MKPRDPDIITHLNRALKNELTAVNQYFLHAKMFSDWGLERIGEYEKKESIDEMRHADALIERILFLEGLPNLQDLGKLMIGEEVKEMLECDLALENAAMPDLRDSIAFAEDIQLSLAGEQVCSGLLPGELSDTVVDGMAPGVKRGEYESHEPEPGAAPR